MNSRKRAIASLLLALIAWLLADGAVESVGTDMRTLSDGIANNDLAAFKDTAALPVDQAAQLLLPYVLFPAANPERAQRARDTLRGIRGFSDYMKGRLSEERSHLGSEYEMAKEFGMLAAIGGEESAATAAAFLFVEDEPIVDGTDFSTGTIHENAMGALRDMYLADTPKDKDNPNYQSYDIGEWKAWAEKKGYKDNSIPRLITPEQKGVPPEVIARSRALLAGAFNQQKPTPATPPGGNRTADIAVTASPQPSASITPRRATPTNPAGNGPSHALLKSLAILASIIVIVVVVMALRKR